VAIQEPTCFLWIENKPRRSRWAWFWRLHKKSKGCPIQPPCHARPHVHRHAPVTASPPCDRLIWVQRTTSCARYNTGCTLHRAPPSSPPSNSVLGTEKRAPESLTDRTDRSYVLVFFTRFLCREWFQQSLAGGPKKNLRAACSSSSERGLKLPWTIPRFPGPFCVD
jgi:hypothetical protein